MLKRKKSLREYHQDKLRREGKTKTVWNRNGTDFKRIKPLKKQSQSQRNRLKKYYEIRAIFLARPENALCQICIARREHGENIRVNPSTEVHHRATRIGKKLCDETDFVASCFPCRLFPHENPKLAREMGILK